MNKITMGIATVLLVACVACDGDGSSTTAVQATISYEVGTFPTVIGPRQPKTLTFTVYGIGRRYRGLDDFSSFALTAGDDRQALLPKLWDDGSEVIRLLDVSGDNISDLTVGFDVDSYLEWRSGLGPGDVVTLSIETVNGPVEIRVEEPRYGLRGGA